MGKKIHINQTGQMKVDLLLSLSKMFWLVITFTLLLIHLIFPNLYLFLTAKYPLIISFFLFPQFYLINEIWLKVLDSYQNTPNDFSEDLPPVGSSFKMHSYSSIILKAAF